MNSGPSKQELQNYWVNNRAYFDSLAKYYLETDKEYYDENIAPFYSPFRPQKGNPKSFLLLGVSFALLIFAAGIVFFIIGVSSEKTPTLDPNKNKKIEDTREKRVRSADTISVEPPVQKETTPRETSPQKTPDNRRTKPIERIR
jgi:hypothetical protein